MDKIKKSEIRTHVDFKNAQSNLESLDCSPEQR